jgi:ankyrin repeat protein
MHASILTMITHLINNNNNKIQMHPKSTLPNKKKKKKKKKKNTSAAVIDARDAQKRTALHVAMAPAGSIIGAGESASAITPTEASATLARTLVALGASPSAHGAAGRTVLMEAVRSGRVELVRLLLSGAWCEVDDQQRYVTSPPLEFLNLSQWEFQSHHYPHVFTFQ